MDRRTVILTARASLLSAPFASHAQKLAKVWRIGLLANGAPAHRTALHPPPPARRVESGVDHRRLRNEVSRKGVSLLSSSAGRQRPRQINALTGRAVAAGGEVADRAVALFRDALRLRIDDAFARSLTQASGAALTRACLAIVASPSTIRCACG